MSGYSCWELRTIARPVIAFPPANGWVTHLPWRPITVLSQVAVETSTTSAEMRHVECAALILLEQKIESGAVAPDRRSLC